MALDISHFPSDLGEKLLEENLEDAIYTILEEQGFQLDWADQAIQSTLADDFTAQHLEVKKGMPVLLVERTVFTAEGRSVEFTRAFYRADRYAYRIRLKRKGSPSSKAALKISQFPAEN